MKQSQEKKGRYLRGVVSSDKMDKTIRVEVTTRIKHPKYGKIVTRTTKVSAHDPDNICKTGDLVEIRECRPISKNKCWILVNRVEQTAKEVV